MSDFLILMDSTWTFINSIDVFGVGLGNFLIGACALSLMVAFIFGRKKA